MKLFLGILAASVVLSGCVIHEGGRRPSGGPSYGNYGSDYGRGDANYNERGGERESGGRYRSGGGERSRDSEVREWGEASSSERGEKGGCHVKVAVTYQPKGWITAEDSQRFYNFLKYTICSQLAPEGVKEKMEVHKPPSFVTDLSQFEGIGSKGTYKLADGKKSVVWTPDNR